jgi:hypothetical protein
MSWPEVKTDRRTRLAQLATFSVMTDTQLEAVLPTLSAFERVEVLLAKYVGGAVSRAYDGATSAPQADAQIGYHLARKMRPWLFAALSPPDAAPQDWQDIATAPKDGTEMLLWSNAAVVGAYRGALGFHTIPGAFGIHATHWRPLPAPPSSPKEPR